MEAVKSNLDHIWPGAYLLPLRRIVAATLFWRLIICGAMVMLMQAGFAMVESLPWGFVALERPASECSKPPCRQVRLLPCQECRWDASSQSSQSQSPPPLGL